MPKLTIDNREIEVAEGTKIIDAAEQLGIMIPRFCYHPALGSVGACRVCAVKIENAGRLSGVQMSCMIDALDGMKVLTDDPEAVAFRQYVIEWLMINHPHDCPVCDEGGHCLLQDLTVSGGHSIRRFKGEKRTYPDQYLGPLVQHEMNRCIQCYRCSRFYQEFAGYRDLGVMGVAGRVYFGRFTDGILESPFAGNLIDICPTGVYTDKPSRYTGRRWDFERSEGICIHCSLGCHITVSARNREIVRHEACFNESVNGHFICDRGRYGFYYANLPDRPRKGWVDGQLTTPSEAAHAALGKLDRICDQYGALAVAAVGSGRSSTETLFALKSLCLQKGWDGPVYWPDQKHAQAVRTAVYGLKPYLAVSMSEIESSDFILTAGTDVLAEAPMLALAIRQASRRDAFVAAIDPRPLDWPLVFSHINTGPIELASVIEKFINIVAGGQKERDAFSALPENLWPLLETTAEALIKSKNPVIICSTGLVAYRVVKACTELTEGLYRAGKQAGIFHVLPQANSYGAAILDDAAKSMEGVVEGIESGDIKALVAVESDAWDQVYDQQRLMTALSRLELLVVLDYLNSDLLQRANIKIPTRTIYEAGGIFINQEGRAQYVSASHAGGTPITITGNGNHPPRTFQPDIPGGDVPPAWRVLGTWQGLTSPIDRRELIRQMGDAEPTLAQFHESGNRLFSERQMPFAVNEHDKIETTRGSEYGYMLLTTASMFGDEPLSCISPCLQDLERPPELWVSEKDSHVLGLANGVSALLTLKYKSIELSIRVSLKIPAGVMVLPRLKSLFWQQMDDARGTWISGDQIKLTGKS